MSGTIDFRHVSPPTYGRERERKLKYVHERRELAIRHLNKVAPDLNCWTLGQARMSLLYKETGPIFRDVEIHVDGVAVWRGWWEQESEYVYQYHEKWLADPERFV